MLWLKRHRAEPDPHPALPVARVYKRSRDAERGDARVAEGEDDVARRDFAHGLVEGIAGFVSVALGRPKIATGDFVAVGFGFG